MTLFSHIAVANSLFTGLNILLLFSETLYELTSTLVFFFVYRKITTSSNRNTQMALPHFFPLRCSDKNMELKYRRYHQKLNLGF